MHLLKSILTILEVLLVFNLLIFVHELGHFLAARWRKLKIERFAIWFGKPIWSTKLNGVEYALGWIPAGGYVSLPQMATMEVIEGKTEKTQWSDRGDAFPDKVQMSEEELKELPPISALDKIIVAFAGPLFSFGLAVVFAAVVWGVGKPVYEADKTTVVGWVDPDGPAGKAGLKPGDQIVKIDGHPVTHFTSTAQDSITWRVITSEEKEIALTYIRDGVEKTATATPYRRPTKWYERRAMRQILISPAQKALVYDVATNSPAEAAGLRRGDEIVALNGEKVFSPMAVTHAEESMTNANAAPVTVTIERDAKRFDATLLAEKPLRPTNSDPSFGIIAWQGNTNVAIIHPGPWEQIEASVGQIVNTLRTVFSKKSDVGVQQLGGAVMIIRVYSNFLEGENGWRWVLWFSVVLNVNLAMLNMLPFPVLDGGHITLAILELIRRRPVNPKLLQYIQTACAVALIGFMLFIAFFDTGDWVRSARRDREEPIVFSPKK